MDCPLYEPTQYDTHTHTHTTLCHKIYIMNHTHWQVVSFINSKKLFTHNIQPSDRLWMWWQWKHQQSGSFSNINCFFFVIFKFMDITQLTSILILSHFLFALACDE